MHAQQNTPEPKEICHTMCYRVKGPDSASSEPHQEKIGFGVELGLPEVTPAACDWHDVAFTWSRALAGYCIISLSVTWMHSMRASMPAITVIHTARMWTSVHAIAKQG